MSLNESTTILTRKSSCVNARGIPTAAYQVLHGLSCPGGWGPGYHPPQSDLTGVPLSDLPGIPPLPPQLDLARGTPHQTWAGYPPSPSDLARLSSPSDLAGVRPHQTWLGYPPPSDLAGVPPPGVERLKTLPSPILRMRSVITS